jgi:imidazolonepropionase-like amidohydrolase
LTAHHLSSSCAANANAILIYSDAHVVDVVANYCGAHSVNPGATAAEETKRIIETEIPEIARLTASGDINAELIDVFCETGVFEIADSKAILEAGLKVGMKANFHGDELTPLAGAEMGASIGAVAVSHLEHVTSEGAAAMAKAGTVACVLPVVCCVTRAQVTSCRIVILCLAHFVSRYSATHHPTTKTHTHQHEQPNSHAHLHRYEHFRTLLPTTAYVLRIDVPPARMLIDAGVAVALGSDFNPNAHCLSMPHVMNLACVTMRMTMDEALIAATINAAASMCRAETHGSLEAGKHGDFVVVDAADWRHLIYEQVDPPIAAVYKQGALVFSRGANVTATLRK